MTADEDNLRKIIGLQDEIIKRMEPSDETLAEGVKGFANRLGIPVCEPLECHGYQGYKSFSEHIATNTHIPKWRNPTSMRIFGGRTSGCIALTNHRGNDISVIYKGKTRDQTILTVDKGSHSSSARPYNHTPKRDLDNQLHGAWKALSLCKTQYASPKYAKIASKLKGPREKTERTEEERIYADVEWLESKGMSSEDAWDKVYIPDNKPEY